MKIKCNLWREMVKLFCSLIYSRFEVASYGRMNVLTQVTLAIHFLKRVSYLIFQMTDTSRFSTIKFVLEHSSKEKIHGGQVR